MAALPLARTPRRARPSGAWLVVVSATSVQCGQALAKLAFPWAAPAVVVGLRFGLGALVLWALFRPRPPADAGTWRAVLSLGTALAGVNLFFFEAAARLPLGLAVTVQFLGALVVSLAGARRPRHALWALLAAGGVALINFEPAGEVSWSGLGFAAASAVCWGAYVVLTARVGARTSGGEGLTWATTWAAVLTVPVGLVVDPGALADQRVLGLGLGVALLCTVLANSLELAALRRIPTRVFGVLVSLEPAVAALAGLVLLGEHLAPAQWIAVGAIVAASVGIAADSGAKRDREPVDA